MKKLDMDSTESRFTTKSIKSTDSMKRPNLDQEITNALKKRPGINHHQIPDKTQDEESPVPITSSDNDNKRRENRQNSF